MIGMEDSMEALVEGDTLKGFERNMGYEIGVVRMSLGLGSNFVDVWNVLNFMRKLSMKSEREALMKEWKQTGAKRH
jgi:molybdenum cofactor sulfurtransferase